MIVDLPEPVEPTRKTNSPGWMANVASSSPMSPLGYFFDTERKSTTAPATGSPTTRRRGGAGSGRLLMWRSVAAIEGQEGTSPDAPAPLPATDLACAGGTSAACRLPAHGEDPLLHPPQRAAALPGRRARNARRDGAGGLRGRRAHRAPGGERNGSLPRAPRVQGRRQIRRLPQGQRDGRAHGRGAQRLHLARPRRVPHHVPRGGRRRGDRPADGLRGAAE